MRDQTKNALMWALYAVLFLLCVVVETVVFGKPRFLLVKIDLIPVCLACIAMHLGAENGALFCLAGSLFWYLSGGDCGAVLTVVLTFFGALAGYLCDRYLNRRFLSAFLMSLLLLTAAESTVFFLKCYLGGASLADIRLLPRQILLSMPAVLVFYPAAWLIRKVGA